MKTKSPTVQALAWGSMLLLSLLPNILFQELTGNTPEWLPLGKYILLTVLLWLTFFWEPARKLRSLFMVFVALFLVEDLFSLLATWKQWQLWFGGEGFALNSLGVQLRKVGAALVIILALLGFGFRRRAFFLRRGELDAPAAPMPLLGFKKGSHWMRLGPALAAYISIALLAVLWLVSRPNAAAWRSLLPLLPAVLVLAAMHSFAGEITYRVALLAPSHRVLGGEQAIWLMAGYFGISHYYSVFTGPISALLYVLLGWVLGRAMLESKGLFWPWMIHMASDIVIFSFVAIGVVTPGGA